MNKIRIVMMAVRSVLLVLAGALIGRALGDPLGGALIFCADRGNGLRRPSDHPAVKRFDLHMRFF